MTFELFGSKTCSLLAVLISVGSLSACGAESMEQRDFNDESEASIEDSDISTNQAALSGPYLTRVYGALESYPPGQLKTLSKSCPSGGLVVGGGARGAASGLNLLGSYPDSKTQWRAILHNPTSNYTEARPYAVCLMNASYSSTTLERSAEHSVQPGTERSVNATCSTGTLIGGGFTIWETSNVRAIQSRRLEGGTSWTARMENWDTNEAAGFRTHAICLSGVSVYTAEKVSVTYVDPGQNGGIEATCADGYHVTSNGFWVGRVNQGTSNNLLLYRSYPAAGGVGGYVRGLNNGTGTISLASHALCVKIR